MALVPKDGLVHANQRESNSSSATLLGQIVPPSLISHPRSYTHSAVSGGTNSELNVHTKSTVAVAANAASELDWNLGLVRLLLLLLWWCFHWLHLMFFRHPGRGRSAGAGGRGHTVPVDEDTCFMARFVSYVSIS
jgi:hypothetical protein